MKLDRKNLLITEGVSGAIKNILDSTNITKKTEIIVPNPSFALYKIYSKVYNIKVKTYNYDNSFNLKINDIFNIYWSDNVKSRLINQKDANVYKSDIKKSNSLRSQLEIYNYYKSKIEN